MTRRPRNRHVKRSAEARRIGELMAAHDARIVDLERRLENMIRPGTVHDVDPAKQRARLVIGKDADGTPQLGPWRPYAQHAGALKGHTPPVIGQQMLLFSPSGDVEQGVHLPYTWSKANPSPGQTADHVWTYLAQINVTMSDGKLVLTIPDTTVKVDDNHSWQLTKDGFKHVGPVTGQATKDDPPKTIDHTHKHGGVTPGGADTDVPQ